MWCLRLPGKGSERTVVQVVHCTRVPAQQEHKWGLHPPEEGASFSNSTEPLYEIVVRREPLPHSPPKNKTKTNSNSNSNISLERVLPLSESSSRF